MENGQNIAVTLKWLAHAVISEMGNFIYLYQWKEVCFDPFYLLSFHQEPLLDLVIFEIQLFP